MMSNKLIYLPSILLILFQPLLTQQVCAGEYVPPPTGPYKSAVVINTQQSQTGEPDQVYKFPSDSLIQSEQRDEPVFLSDRHIMDLPQNIDSKATVAPQQEFAPTISSQKQSVLTKPRPLTEQFSRNPWAPGPLPDPGAYQDSYYQGGGFQQYRYPGSAYPGTFYQGDMNYPQYSYPQQNPYTNSNQYNFMNAPFNSMPSPWSSMPMQSFFSGR